MHDLARYEIVKPLRSQCRRDANAYTSTLPLYHPGRNNASLEPPRYSQERKRPWLAGRPRARAR